MARSMPAAATAPASTTPTTARRPRSQRHAGGANNDPTNQGGALRSQDLRTAGDHVTLDGSIIRIDPDTGAALPDNPLSTTQSANGKRHRGLRPPQPLPVHVPSWHERAVGRRRGLEHVRGDQPHRRHHRQHGRQHGLALLRGHPQQSGYASLPRSARAFTPRARARPSLPYFSYQHQQVIIPGETCGTGSSSVSGLAFYRGRRLSRVLSGRALLRRLLAQVRLGDAQGHQRPARHPPRSHTIIGRRRPGHAGQRPRRRHPLRRVRRRPAAPHPLCRRQSAADGGDFRRPVVGRFAAHGLVQRRRIERSRRPDAVVRVGPRRRRQLRRRHRPDPVVDLHRRRRHDDHRPRAGLRYWRSVGRRGRPDPLNGTRPTAVIDTPTGSLQWKVGDAIGFSGRGLDPDEPGGQLPASALQWEVIINHCPSDCHVHSMQTFNGVASGSFNAPDHDTPRRWSCA